MIRLRDIGNGYTSTSLTFMTVKRYRYDDIKDIFEECLYLLYRENA